MSDLTVGLLVAYFAGVLMVYHLSNYSYTKMGADVSFKSLFGISILFPFHICLMTYQLLLRPFGVVLQVGAAIEGTIIEREGDE